MCHRCWQPRWQQDHPALAVLCVYGGENVSILYSREDQDTKTVSLLTHSVLLRHSLHPGQRVSLVGAAGRCGHCCRASPAASDSKSSDCRDCGSGLREQVGSEEGTVRVACASPLTILRKLGIPGSGTSCAGGLIYVAVRSCHFQRS